MKITNALQKVSVVMATCVALSCSETAQALTFSEPPDAGGRLGTAADTTASTVGNDSATTLTRITGALVGHADLFKISVKTGIFSASTLLADVDPDGTIEDTQLFLFDSLGKGIVANDDNTTGDLRSKITQFLTAGIYYLGISKYNIDPVDSNGNPIFPDNFTGQVISTNLNPLHRFAGEINAEAGRRTYTIAVNSTPIPTPALLPGLIGMGLGVLRKRKAEAVSEAK